MLSFQVRTARFLGHALPQVSLILIREPGGGRYTIRGPLIGGGGDEEPVADGGGTGSLFFGGGLLRCFLFICHFIFIFSAFAR